MERRNSSDKTAICKQVLVSLLMLCLGLGFSFLLTTLAYYTYQTLAGNVTFCSLWIDVPGRALIFLTCYYIASMCGFFPLPQRYRLNNFIEPFKIWRLESWRRLFRNVFLPTPSLNLITKLQRNAVTVRDSPETPLLQESDQENFYDCSPIRRRSTPVGISYPNSYVASVFVSHRESPPSNVSPVIDKSSNGSLTSIDSSVGGVIFPITKVKSSKPHYLPECRSQESPSESPDDRNAVTSKYRKIYTEAKWVGKFANAIPDTNSGATANTNQDTTLKLHNSGAQLNFPEIHDRNQQPGISTTTVKKRESKLTFSNSETQLKIPGIHERNQLGLASADNERKTTPKFRSTERKIIFPRFPWCYLRNPRGVPVGANKLHKKNLELENRLRNLYLNRQKKQADLEKIARSLLTSLCNERVTRTQLQRSIQNTNIVTKNLFQTESGSAEAAVKSSGEQTQTRCMTRSVLSKNDVDQTANKSELSRKDEMRNIDTDQATNMRRPLFSRKSNPSQRQEEEIMRDDQTANTRRPLFSQTSNLSQRREEEILRDDQTENMRHPLISKTSNLSQRQEEEIIRDDQAANMRRPLFSQTSSLTQKQEELIMRDSQAASRRRLLPSQRFRRKVRSSPEIQTKPDKTDSTIEALDLKDSGMTAILDVGPLNLPKVKQDTERTANESSEKLQVGDLKERQFQFGQSTQPFNVALKSNQTMRTETEVQTTSAIVKSSADSDASRRSSGADVKISVALSTNKCGANKESDPEELEK